MLKQVSFALRHAAITAGSAAVIGCAHAQPAVTPMTPSEPHEALAFFEGTWTTSDAKPDEFRETCAWLAEGRRHMICRSRWRAATGYREGRSIFSYDPASGEYRYHGFRAGGAVVTHSGRRLPNGWLFTSDQGAGEHRVRTRITIERSADGRFSFMSETSKGGDAWRASPKVEYVRVDK